MQISVYNISASVGTAGGGVTNLYKSRFSGGRLPVHSPLQEIGVHAVAAHIMANTAPAADDPPAGAFVDAPLGKGAVTDWGEVCRPRLTRAQTGGRLAILDYRAPAGFGPGRHVHLNDDEIFLVQQGEMALWTPGACCTAGPGDLVFLPRAVPHTWRSCSHDEVRLQVIVAPGQFEDFFGPLAEQGLTLSDQTEMAEVAASVGVKFLGPPLSDDEVAAIWRGEQI